MGVAQAVIGNIACCKSTSGLGGYTAGETGH